MKILDFLWKIYTFMENFDFSKKFDFYEKFSNLWNFLTFMKIVVLRDRSATWSPV